MDRDKSVKVTTVM